MLSFPDFASLQSALTLPLDATLHRLIFERVANAIACCVENMTHILVVEPGDTEADFLREAAFSPFTNPSSECRYGDPAFHPHWDWVGWHHGWFEWLTCIGDSGFALIVFVPARDGVDPRLVAMLQEFILCDGWQSF
jgi:hypothetical protein